MEPHRNLCFNTTFLSDPYRSVYLYHSTVGYLPLKTAIAYSCAEAKLHITHHNTDSMTSESVSGYQSESRNDALSFTCIAIAPRTGVRKSTRSGQHRSTVRLLITTSASE